MAEAPSLRRPSELLRPHRGCADHLFLEPCKAALRVPILRAMLPPRYLWLLLPLSCWSGYMTAPRGAAAATAGEAKEELRDPRVMEWAAELATLKTGPELGKELEALLRQPQAGTDEAERLKRQKLICARWVEIDPAEALAWCGSHEGAQGLRPRVLAEWAMVDSEAAWKASTGDEERESVAGILLAEDPEVFMGWFRRLKRPVPDGSPAWRRLAERHGKELEEIVAGKKK